MTGFPRLLVSYVASLLLWSCVPVTPPDPPQNSGRTAAEDLASRLHLPPTSPVPGLLELNVSDGSPPRVSIRCTETPMHRLLPLLAEKTGIAFHIGRIQPVFKVSAQLLDVPLPECLSILFQGSDYILSPYGVGHDQVWVVKDRPQQAIAAANSMSTTLISLHHTPAETVTSKLLGVGQGTGLIHLDSSVTAAAVDAHSISLKGSQDKLFGLSKILRQADQPTPSILMRVRKFATIEELILTYFGNPSAGYSYQGGPWTSFSIPNSTQSNISVGSAQQNLAAGAAIATYAGSSDRPGFLQSLLSGLVQRIKEDYFADTQLTVLSGQSASIVAGRQGFLLTPSYTDGFVVNQSFRIDATTSLKVTPTALPNGEIRMELTFSSYRLIPNEFDLVGTIRGANQTAYLQIPPGQPVIVSGSTLTQLSNQWDGWSRLRNVPILGSLLTASTEDLLLEDGLVVVWAEILPSSDPRSRLVRDIGTPPSCPLADDKEGTSIYSAPSIL